jgi:hypothetical protein
MKYPNGSESVLSPGPFAQLIKVLNCPCSDGESRTIRRIGVPDTAFSAPGDTRVKGKTVTGFVTCDEEGYIFIANEFGKNGHLLP